MTERVVPRFIYGATDARAWGYVVTGRGDSGLIGAPLPILPLDGSRCHLCNRHTGVIPCKRAQSCQGTDTTGCRWFAKRHKRAERERAHRQGERVCIECGVTPLPPKSGRGRPAEVCEACVLPRRARHRRERYAGRPPVERKLRNVPRRPSGSEKRDKWSEDLAEVVWYPEGAANRWTSITRGPYIHELPGKVWPDQNEGEQGARQGAG